jgi:hypothetical protein
MKAFPRLFLLLSVVGMSLAASSCVVETDSGCIASIDNFCSDPWYLNYCDDATGIMYEADCHVSCRTEAAVYGPTCGAPAAVGECDDLGGLCICYCDDAFDQCVSSEVVQYTRDGTTYEADCKDVCVGGVCDANAAACACP